MAAVDERVNIIDRILSNRIKKTEVEKELERLENQYGEDAYTDDAFRPKEKPWNKTYYLELEKASMAGVSSKKFIIHLVEVRDYLQARLIATIAVIGLAIVCTIIIMIMQN